MQSRSWMLAVLTSLSASAGSWSCGDDDIACEEGSEGCACFPNHTCLAGLRCASDYCVDLDSSRGDADGGDRDGGRPSGASGTSGTKLGTRDGGGSGGTGGEGGEGGSGGTVPQGDECERSSECAPVDEPCSTAVCVGGKCDQASKPAGSAASGDTKGDCQRLVCGEGGQLTTQADPADAPEPGDDPCMTWQCDGVTPRSVPTAAGTVLARSAQTSGDCSKVVCDGQGGVRNDADDSDVSDEPADAVCRVRACESGAPTMVPAPAGTSCGSGQVCNSQGSCVTCVADGMGCTASTMCCGGLCNAAGVCASCAAGTADCDASPSNACEASLTTTTHCGACGHACGTPTDVASARCATGGECAVNRCKGGRADVDGEFANGCEATATVGSGGAYGPCTKDDAATVCGPGERCVAATAVGGFLLSLGDCGANSTGCFCAYPCNTDTPVCPAGAGGTATSKCSSGLCYLSCSNTLTCPTGMECGGGGSIPGLAGGACIWE